MIRFVESTNKWKAIVMILLTLAIIIVNLAGLYYTLLQS